MGSLPRELAICEELEGAFDDRVGSLLGNEVCGAVDNLQFQIVAVFVVTADVFRADDGVSVLNAGQHTGMRAQFCPGFPVCAAQDASALRRDEVAVQGRTCPGAVRFRNGARKSSMSCSDQVSGLDACPQSRWRVKMTS